MQTTLHYQDQRSNKVYQIGIESQNGGYVVNFAYGREGSTLNTGTKTTTPQSFDTAQKIYDRVVKEKLAKGYTQTAGGTGYVTGTQKQTGTRPQLLNPIDDAETLLTDEAFCLQPKHDGKRLLLHKQGQTLTGINRRGLECGFPESLRVAAKELPADFLLDGEVVGDILHVFDLLELNSADLRPLPYKSRLVELLRLLASGQQSAIQWVATINGTNPKRCVFEQLKHDNAEGVVFKRILAPYAEGRPNSGGDQFKFKFVETASVIVQAVNAKRSVGIAVRHNGRLVPAGNVTIPANHVVPPDGSIADVRYLYAMPESGALFQPVYLGTRDDITAEECTRDQLKFRNEPAEVAA